MNNTADEFEDKVVIVTGAGRGLGRSHAIEFARRGAKVVVNDSGGGVDGTGSSNTAQSVVDEITEFGGIAIANTASVAIVSEAQSIVNTAMDTFGSVDILINNAGILRDKTFTNVTMDNFRAVLDVHLLGSVYVTKAAWPVMSSNGWGRIVLTSSGSGIFGNFGQANYGTAKMGLLGFMNVLKLEGAKRGIRTNCLAPGATTRMTEGLPSGILRGKPEQVSPAVLYLSSDDAPNGVILQASGGNFSILKMCVNEGIELGDDVDYETFKEVASSLMLNEEFKPHD
jgi:NAD(P)-dependent dehydrogenase (short-subunit alcohol dehydrogenase family)